MQILQLLILFVQLLSFNHHHLIPETPRTALAAAHFSVITERTQRSDQETQHMPIITL